MKWLFILAVVASLTASFGPWIWHQIDPISGYNVAHSYIRK